MEEIRGIREIFSNVAGEKGTEGKIFIFLKKIVRDGGGEKKIESGFATLTRHLIHSLQSLCNILLHLLDCLGVSTNTLRKTEMKGCSASGVKEMT